MRFLEDSQYYYRVERIENTDVLYIAEPPADSSNTVELVWHKLDPQNLPLLPLQVQRVNAFFHTAFAYTGFETVLQESNMPHYVVGNFKYRVVVEGEHKILQRAYFEGEVNHDSSVQKTEISGPRTLKYNKQFEVKSYTMEWENVHDGEKVLVHIEEKELERINAHFESAFKRY